MQILSCFRYCLDLYENYRNSEIAAKDTLIDFEAKYPDVTNIDNVNDIINSLKKRQKIKEKFFKS